MEGDEDVYLQCDHKPDQQGYGNGFRRCISADLSRDHV